MSLSEAAGEELWLLLLLLLRRWCVFISVSIVNGVRMITSSSFLFLGLNFSSVCYDDAMRSPVGGSSTG
jgi:hypothetical protein